MKPLDYIRMASKNIMRQKLRTALTIFAIMIGATSVTIMLALVTGAKGFFYSQFEQSGALQQVIVSQGTDLDFKSAQWGSNNSDGTKLTDAIADKVKQIPHVTAISRMANPYNFESVTYGDKKLAVRNVQAHDYNGVIKFDMAAGRSLNDADGSNAIMITSQYADKMGFKGNYNGLVGQKITLTTSPGFSGPGSVLPQPTKNADGSYTFPEMDPEHMPRTNFTPTVVGIVSNSDDATIYFTLSWANDLMTEQHYNMVPDGPRHRNGFQPMKMELDKKNRLADMGYSNITVQVDQTSNVEGVASEIRKLQVGASTAASYIQDQIKIFNVIGFVLGGIGAISLAVAAIGVINTMVMAMLERTREIGIMRAVGARRSTVRNLFTIEAATIGFWGGVFGVAVGYALTRVANVIINKQLIANSVKSSDIIGLPLWLILGVIAATTLIGMVAGLYPAYRAARLNPVDALRYE